MGGLVTTLRDIKTVMKDLKITLKLTAKVILKVHTIMEDLEETVQELKRTAKCVSAKIPFHEEMPRKTRVRDLSDRMEMTAQHLKSTVVDAVAQVDTKGLLRGTHEKWKRVMEYSRERTKTVTELMALSNSLQELAEPRPLAKTEELCDSSDGSYDAAEKGKADNSLNVFEVTTKESIAECISLTNPFENMDNVLEILDLEGISLLNLAQPFCRLRNAYFLNMTCPTTMLPSPAESVLLSGGLEWKLQRRGSTLWRFDTTRTQARRATCQVPVANMWCLFLILGELILLDIQQQEGTNGE